MSNIEEVSFSADGQLLNQLSSQVSSHLFALGELLKNSYDAQATEISVILDLSENKLIVSDNGIGISRNDVRNLLHIGGSNKQYGKTFKFELNGKPITRITQGSKGLGLLSAFKFGNVVTWHSNTLKNSFSLTVNKEDVVNSYNIGEINFPLQDTNLKTRGTKVIIDLKENDPEIAFIFEIFSNLKDPQKLVQFFYQNNIKVSFDLIDTKGNSVNGFPMVTIDRTKLNNELLTNKILNIDYNSIENKVKFTDVKTGKSVITNSPIEVEKGTYILFIHLNAYFFKSRGTKKINKIFHNSRGDLSPLIYINSVLFNNDNLFDPSITRKTKSDKVLSQLTGFIRILTSNPSLQFNNERTELIQNSFNSKIREDLRKLNIFIQEEAKKISKNFEHDDQNIDALGQTTEDDNVGTVLNQDEDNDIQQVSIETNRTEDNVLEAINEPSIEQEDENIDEVKVPSITLVKNKETIHFPDNSPLINLKDYFVCAENSKGEDVAFEALRVEVNGKVTNPPILQSRSENYIYNIVFSFEDPYENDPDGNFIKAVKNLSLILKYRPASFIKPINDEKLINPIGFEYQFKLPGVGRLIQQINLLYENYDEFDICLVASLRLVFDLTTFEFESVSGHSFSKKGLDNKVEEMLELLTTDKKILTKVAEKITSRFSVLENILSKPGRFIEHVSLSNLGTHTGHLHLTKEDVKDLAKYAGCYAQLVDAYCKVKG